MKTKAIDSVKLMRNARSKISRRVKNMSFEEEKEYLRKRTEYFFAGKKNASEKNRKRTPAAKKR